MEDHLIIPDDPRGFHGPSLVDMLEYSNKTLKKVSKKHIKNQQMKKAKSIQLYSPANASSSNSNSSHEKVHQFLSLNSDLKTYQVELYRQACDMFPSDESLIKSILRGNPEVIDLNTLMNFVIMAMERK